LKKHQLLVK